MLTARQRATLEFIRNYVVDNDIAPTMKEIAIGIGIKSKGVVHRYVQALADAGFIEIVPSRHRNIRLLELDDNRSSQESESALPLLGKIAAGCPIEAIPDEQLLNFTHSFVKENHYALKVVGDSMIDIGIFEDDYVICEKRCEAKNGEIVVALIDQQEATLKRYHREKEGMVTLTPENKALKPMVFSGDRVQIQGVFVGLVRMHF